MNNKNVEKHPISDKIYDRCKELLWMELLAQNDFPELYGEELDDVLACEKLFTATQYLRFDDEETRLLFLYRYFVEIKNDEKYVTFFEFLSKWEKSQTCQRHVNAAKISLSLKIPDITQWNRFLRDTGSMTTH